MLDAALVMRDRESDSWWAIMSGKAIGGEMEGTPLAELPLGEKTTWGQWVKKHPESLVLTVDGMQYDEGKPYANYFQSDGTFRGMQIEDERLPPKESIYSFQWKDRAYAVANSNVENGLLVSLGENTPQKAFFYRQQGLSLFGSTHALLVPPDLLQRDDGGWSVWDGGELLQIPDGVSIEDSQEVLGRLAEMKEVERLSGFDTFWYTWVAQHPNTVLLP